MEWLPKRNVDEQECLHNTFAKVRVTHGFHTLPKKNSGQKTTNWLVFTILSWSTSITIG